MLASQKHSDKEKMKDNPSTSGQVRGGGCQQKLPAIADSDLDAAKQVGR
jgi:hypothetical protein